MTIRKYLLTRWMSKVAEFATEIIFLIYFHHPKVFSQFLSFYLIFCLPQAKTVTSFVIVHLVLLDPTDRPTDRPIDR